VPPAAKNAALDSIKAISDKPHALGAVRDPLPLRLEVAHALFVKLALIQVE